MKVLSIDTGSKKSGWSIFDGQTLYEKGITPNNELIELIGMFYFDVAIIEHFNIYMVDLSANNPTKSGKKIIGTRFGLENLNTLDLNFSDESLFGFSTDKGKISDIGV